MELSQQAMLQKFENLSCQHWHITLALIEEHHEIFCLTFVVELLRIHLDIWWQLWWHIVASSNPNKEGHGFALNKQPQQPVLYWEHKTKLCHQYLWHFKESSWSGIWKVLTNPTVILHFRPLGRLLFRASLLKFN